MLNRLIDVSVAHKGIVIAVTAMVAFGGWWAMPRLPLDALPDLGETQVIVFSQWDRSPDVIEDQVTFPIVTALVGAPGIQAVRAVSDFGASFIYAVFEDGTDVYWARARTLEYLAAVTSTLPEGVTPQLGPDATSLGWIYQYVVIDDSGTHSLADLRSIQDWYLRYHLRSVPGVAEVASIGGFERQYQVNIDPNRLRAHGIPLRRVVDAVRGSNSEVSGRVIEAGGAEYVVRGRGYARTTRDFENIVLTEGGAGPPVRIRDVAQVSIGPDMRRGLADLDGTGDVVSGIVVMRQSQSALDVIDRVKSRLREIEPGLPAGVKVVGIYDRSDLIRRAIRTLRAALLEITATVAIVVLLFLWHPPSAVIPLLVIPLTVLVSFGLFRLTGISANIMSLSGIAIALGTLVDSAIVVVEQTHKRLEEWERDGRHGSAESVVIGAVKEVTATSFFALLAIAVSFLPVLTLEGREGRLFAPLALAKTLVIVVAAILAVTFDPAVRVLFTRLRRISLRPPWLQWVANEMIVGRIRNEDTHPVSRLLIRMYEPAVRWSLRWKWTVIAAAAALVLATVPAFLRLGSEFMPPLDEGALFYMPSVSPGISVAEAQALLQRSDEIIKTFPEVERVLGKAGRADTATDPAPLSMLETVIILKPTAEWRKVPTWYSAWAPDWITPPLRRVTPDHIETEQLIGELDRALRFPGVSNAWTMPIQARTDMLATGIRSPLGLKVTGKDVAGVESLADAIAAALREVPGTRNVFSDRIGSGRFLDIAWDRERLARHGVLLEDAQMAVQAAIGGENVTTTVEGRERYAVNVRYLRDFRDTPEAIEQLLIPGGRQGWVSLIELATVTPSTGPAMIRTDGGLVTAYVYVDLDDANIERYITAASNVLSTRVDVPQGYAVIWSGQYEAILRARERLRIVVPMTLALVVIFVYFGTRSVGRTAIVCLAVPFSAVGAVWFLALLDYNVSVAVWVGLIALAGLDAETGMFMLLYLDIAYDKARREGRLGTLAGLRDAIVEGAARRVRPKFMTVATAVLGLAPIMWATGAGSDVMKRIAAPMIGGLITSFVLELLVYPALYEAWRMRQQPEASAP